jgi:hypothetical protein
MISLIWHCFITSKTSFKVFLLMVYLCQVQYTFPSVFWLILIFARFCDRTQQASCIVWLFVLFSISHFYAKSYFPELLEGCVVHMWFLNLVIPLIVLHWVKQYNKVPFWFHHSRSFPFISLSTSTYLSIYISICLSIYLLLPWSRFPNGQFWEALEW